MSKDRFQTEGSESIFSSHEIQTNHESNEELKSSIKTNYLCGQKFRKFFL